MSDKSFSYGSATGSSASFGGSLGGDYATSYGQQTTQPAPAQSPTPGATLDLGGGAPAGPTSIDVTTATFMADVIEASRTRPVVVDFWAPWCGPCRTLGPVIEKVVAEQKGKVLLAKMDIDQSPEIAGQMGIQSIPAVVAFVNGQPADAFMGARPEGEVRRFVEKLAEGNRSPEESQMAAQVEAMLEAARAMEANGDHAGAAEAYGRLAQVNPDDAEALAGLGRCYLAAGQPDTARQLLGQLPEDLASKEPLVALARSLDLADEAAEVGEVAELKAKVDASPDDHQARFDYAVALNGKGRREEAAEQLLHIVKADREWNEDGARAKLVELFEAWGPKDPATMAGRRGLSSVLFR